LELQTALIQETTSTTAMIRFFKKTVTASALGESFADAVVTTHTQLESDFPQVGIAPDRVFEELIYLDTFIFEQVVNRVFAEEALQQAILNGYSARLVFGHLKKQADRFQSDLDDRRSSFGVAWCAPPDQKASMHVAGEICRRCESLHYELLMFFATQVARSYAATLQLLTKAKTENKIAV
jgi:hypothetical protein